ncbi:MAG: hypothetical protein LQ340_003846 [Diploschistes diacapsis]|nr:MAG: hypothetical protein LQ340_003846 [Diploschistes diacapsis]
MPSQRPNRPPRSSSSIVRPKRPSRSLSMQHKTEIIINVYDLLPQSTFSSILWACGVSLLHTGIVINNREYSYGAVPHPTEPSSTGVFWTRPRLEPPGGTFRQSILQGFTYLSPAEIEQLVRDVSARFPGKEYNLLTNNCNHFTSYLCRILTHREAPAFLNRAAKLGKVMPCLVPGRWLEPPTMDDMVDDGDANNMDDDERPMLWRDRNLSRMSLEELDVRDVEGRRLPPSERAPPERLI